MMKTSGRIMICCVALFLALTSVSAVQRLNSIRDLMGINFGQSVPRHSLVLLHWFANTVEIDYDDDIQLTFNPNRGDYGSHHYGNYEELLDPLPRGYQYYTVGNLNQDNTAPRQLPPHVVYPRSEYEGNNRDRIIIRVTDSLIIDQVYITQHYAGRQGGEYDPAHTYQVTVDLLRQIREFRMAGNLQLLRNLRDHFGSNANDSQLSNIRNSWGDLACLGLLLFIVIPQVYYSNQSYTRLHGATRTYREPGVWDNVKECVQWFCTVLLVIFLVLLALPFLAIMNHQK